MKDEFTTWSTGRLCSEMWEECGNAILWSFLGAPLIAFGLFALLINLYVAAALISSGIAVLWHGQRRWVAIGRELKRRRQP